MSPEVFEIVEGRNLEQGDIILNCLFVVPSDTDFLDGTEDPSVFVDEHDAIVLTQTCDMVEGQTKVDNVVLCTCPSIGDVLETDGHPCGTKEKIKRANKGQVTAYHVLPGFDSDILSTPPRLVQFGQIHTLPLEFVRHIAAKSGARLRMKSPYREHLSQRFGAFFNRIALPAPYELNL